MKSCVRVGLWLLASSLAVVVAPGPAHVAAQELGRPGPNRPQDAVREGQALAARAKVAFRARAFDDAAKLFMRAYSLTGEAALVFNAARAYEEGGKVGDAIGLFRLYVTIAKDVDGVADAHARIRALEASRASEGPGPEGGGAGRQIQGQGAPRPVAVAGKVVLPGAAAHEGANAVPAESNLAVWVSAGTAGIAAAGGAILLGLGAAESREANSLVIQGDADISAYNQQFNRAEFMRNLGWASVGIAAAAGGLAVWLNHRFAPAVAAIPGQGVVVGWRF